MRWSSLCAAGVCALATFAAPVPLEAQEAPLTVIYVNGIQNVLADTQATAEAIQEILDNAPRSSGSGGRRFAVGWVFNPVGWYNSKLGSDLEQDLTELFLMKSSEEVYLPDLNRIVLPHDEDRQTDRAAAARVTEHLNDMTQGATSLERQDSDPLVGDKQMDLTKKAALELKNWLDGLQRAVVVAHSQGNLLANLAWAATAVEQGNRTGQRMRIVNVANTSAVSVNGLNLTHARDWALFSTGLLSFNPGLEVLPTQKGWTRSTPYTQRCGSPTCAFVLAAPTFLGYQGDIDYPTNLDGVADAALHHSIALTYLNDQAGVTIDANPLAPPRSVDFTSGRRFVDRFVDLVYAAAVALERPALPETVTGAPEMVSSGQPASVTANVGGVATFLVQATGIAPLSYQWRRNGVPVSCSSAIDCARLDWLVTAADDGARFDVVVSNAVGSVTSSVARLTLAVAASPDLAVSGVSFGPSQVTAAGAISVQLSVVNQGTAAAAASTASLRINASSVSAGAPITSRSVSIPALAAGASSSLSNLSLAVPPTPGRYRLWVVLDNGRSSGQAPDAEANDIVLVPGEVDVIAAPAASGPDLIPSSLAAGPAELTVNATAVASVVVANVGSSPSNATQAVFRLVDVTTSGSGGTVVASVPVPPVASPGSTTVEARFPVGSQAGRYRIDVELDPGGLAGQSAAARTNDLLQGQDILSVVPEGLIGGIAGEGAYEGGITGAASSAFRMYVLQDGQFWALYGSISGLGQMRASGFMQGQFQTSGDRFTSADARDFGFVPANPVTATGTFDVSARTLSGSISAPGVNATIIGQPVTSVAYAYAGTSTLSDVTGAWGVQFNTGDLAIVDVAGDGTFASTSKTGCRFSGRVEPTTSGRNVFAITTTFGGAPCLIQNQTASGIAVRHTLSDGWPGMEFAVVTADRRAGIVGSGTK